MSTAAVPVVIVGAGPTGLTAATLLGQYGVECLVLDRWDGVYPQPRAVHLDDEIYRVLVRLGIARAVRRDLPARPRAAAARPNHRVFAVFDRAPATGRHGHPEANMFDQPELEHLLRTNLTHQTTVTLRGNVEVTDVTQDGAGPGAGRLHRPAHRRATSPCSPPTCWAATAPTAWCAPRSAPPWRTSTSSSAGWSSTWTATSSSTSGRACTRSATPTAPRPTCASGRPATAGSSGCRRRDRRRLPRHRPGCTRSSAPWTEDIPVRPAASSVRVAEYTFRAQLADRWRDRRVFLLGDAAHLTPPFIGQGLCAGVRDAMNLTWKIAGVLSGDLPETGARHLPGRAQAARPRAHPAGQARRCRHDRGRRAGQPAAPRARAAAAPAPRRPRTASSTAKRRRCAGPSWWSGRRLRRSLAGRLCPNAPLEDGRRFDDVAAGRFAARHHRRAATPAQRAEVARRGGVVVHGRRRLRPAPAGCAAVTPRAAVVRPDGTVLRAGRDLSRLCSAVPPFTAPSARLQHATAH